jgi:hypothetical protein
MLGVYERRTISVDVKGIANGTTSVQVGVVQSAPSGQFAFENVLQRSFDIKVKCVSSSCTAEQETPKTTTTRISRGGSGGGGIAVMPAVRTNSSQVTSTPPVPASSIPPSVVSDVGGEQSLDLMQAQAPVVVEPLVVALPSPSAENAVVVARSVPMIFYVCLFSLLGSLVLLAVMHRLVRGMSNDDFA